MKYSDIMNLTSRDVKKMTDSEIKKITVTLIRRANKELKQVKQFKSDTGFTPPSLRYINKYGKFSTSKLKGDDLKNEFARVRKYLTEFKTRDYEGSLIYFEDTKQLLGLESAEEIEKIFNFLDNFKKSDNAVDYYNYGGSNHVFSLIHEIKGENPEINSDELIKSLEYELTERQYIKDEFE